MRAIVIKSNYHDDALDYKTTGHNNLPTMPIIPIKHPDRLLIMIFSGSSEKLTSFLPHFSFIFLINHYFLRAVDNDNIWSGSPDKLYSRSQITKKMFTPNDVDVYKDPTSCYDRYAARFLNNCARKMTT